MKSDPLSLFPVQPALNNVRVQRFIARGLIPFQLVLSALPAQAQSAPDAGALRQQIEQGRTPALPKKAPTELAPEPEPMKDPGSAAELTVKEFQLRGNTLMSTPELQESLKPYVDRPLSFAELRGVAAKVGVLYRKRGWVVRAYLPQQEIKDGVFTIQIVEAMYGQTRIEDATTRLPLARVQATVDGAQPAGAPLNADHLDRALLLLNDTGASGAFDDKNAASGKAVRVTGAVLVDGPGGLAGNYTLNDPLGLTASVTPRALTVTGLGADDKVYDSSVAATLRGGVLNGLVAGEALIFKRGGGAFADKNAGSGKSVSATGLSLADDTGLAANYTLGNPAGLTATITPFELAIQGIVVNSKIYDGSTLASLAAPGSISAFAGDSVKLNTATVVASFTDSAIGHGKPVLIGGYSVSGADVANYRLLPPGPQSANINPAPLPPVDSQVVTAPTMPVLCQNFTSLPTVNSATGEVTILSRVAELPIDGGSDAAPKSPPKSAGGNGGCAPSAGAEK